MWVCGCVGVWVCGSVGVCECVHGSEATFQKPPCVFSPSNLPVTTPSFWKTNLKQNLPYDWPKSAVRRRANMAHIRKSRPDSGLGFQAKALSVRAKAIFSSNLFKTFRAVPSALGGGPSRSRRACSLEHNLSGNGTNQTGLRTFHWSASERLSRF